MSFESPHYSFNESSVQGPNFTIYVIKEKRNNPTSTENTYHFNVILRYISNNLGQGYILPNGYNESFSPNEEKRPYEFTFWDDNIFEENLIFQLSISKLDPTDLWQEGTYITTNITIIDDDGKENTNTKKGRFVRGGNVKITKS